MIHIAKCINFLYFTPVSAICYVLHNITNFKLWFNLVYRVLLISFHLTKTFTFTSIVKLAILAFFSLAIRLLLTLLFQPSIIFTVYFPNCFSINRNISSIKSQNDLFSYIYFFKSLFSRNTNVCTYYWSENYFFVCHFLLFKPI